MLSPLLQCLRGCYSCYPLSLLLCLWGCYPCHLLLLFYSVSGELLFLLSSLSLFFFSVSGAVILVPPRLSLSSSVSRGYYPCYPLSSSMFKGCYPYLFSTSVFKRYISLIVLSSVCYPVYTQGSTFSVVWQEERLVWGILSHSTDARRVSWLPHECPSSGVALGILSLPLPQCSLGLLSHQHSGVSLFSGGHLAPS